MSGCNEILLGPFMVCMTYPGASKPVSPNEPQRGGSFVTKISEAGP